MSKKLKCFISYKKENKVWKEKIAEKLSDFDLVDNSLDYVIPKEDGDAVMEVIRKDHLNNADVTLFIIGKNSSELEGYDNDGQDKQFFIRREIQATLYDRKNSPLSGLVGIVLPEMYEAIYLRTENCSCCGQQLMTLDIGDKTVIKEFAKNYFIDKGDKCHWSEEDRFAILVKYEDFIANPKKHVEMAFAKTKEPIANKVTVYVKK